MALNSPVLREAILSPGLLPAYHSLVLFNVKQSGDAENTKRAQLFRN